jgi:pimeloyl-ACP methyl ester carboxylesterase
MLPKRIRVDGLSVRHFEAGKGAPVVLLHGASLGSSADVWTRNLAPLAAHGLRVIAPDLPGFGGTDNPADVSLSYRKKFVLAFMDALKIERAALVGHSQSGRVALDCCRRSRRRRRPKAKRAAPPSRSSPTRARCSKAISTTAR